MISMLKFLIDSMFVSFGGTLFQQVVGILMGTNCAPLLADLFLYSYESGLLQQLVEDERIHDARAFGFTYRYIGDGLSVSGSRFVVSSIGVSSEAGETAGAASSASFVDLCLGFDDSGQLGAKIYDKRDDFSFGIMDFPSVCSSVPSSPACGVCISQLIRCARANGNCSDFLRRRLCMRDRLLDWGYGGIRLVRSLGEFMF